MQWESMRKRESKGESKPETLLETDKDRDRGTEGEEERQIYVLIEGTVRNGQWLGASG